MRPIVAVIASAIISSAVAKHLPSSLLEVRTLLDGRRDATTAQTKAAGMNAASDAQIAAFDFIL